MDQGLSGLIINSVVFVPRLLYRMKEQPNDNLMLGLGQHEPDRNSNRVFKGQCLIGLCLVLSIGPDPFDHLYH